MIYLSPSSSSTDLGLAIRRDLEVGRFDHVTADTPGISNCLEEAADIASVPGVSINLMRSASQRTVAALGLHASVVPRRFAMCDLVVATGRGAHVEDASLDPRWRNNPFVDGTWDMLRFYSAQPLQASSGYVIRTLCVFDRIARRLSEAQVSGLTDLAVRVVQILEESRVAALMSHLSEARSQQPLFGVSRGLAATAISARG